MSFEIAPVNISPVAAAGAADDQIKNKEKDFQKKFNAMILKKRNTTYENDDDNSTESEGGSDDEPAEKPTNPEKVPVSGYDSTEFEDDSDEEPAKNGNLNVYTKFDQRSHSSQSETDPDTPTYSPKPTSSKPTSPFEPFGNDTPRSGSSLSDSDPEVDYPDIRKK